MNLVNIKSNSKSLLEVKNHLKRCDSIFIPKLSSRVDINEYALKIITNATTVELWYSDSIVGLIAIYLNDPLNKNGFITNVSLELKFQGRGLGRGMILNTLDIARKMNYREIRLKVNESNVKAIKLYSEMGFVLIKQENEFLELKINLNL